jgi:hypothetical protein
VLFEAAGQRRRGEEIGGREGVGHEAQMEPARAASITLGRHRGTGDDRRR